VEARTDEQDDKDESVQYDNHSICPSESDSDYEPGDTLLLNKNKILKACVSTPVKHGG